MDGRQSVNSIDVEHVVCCGCGGGGGVGVVLLCFFVFVWVCLFGW